MAKPKKKPDPGTEFKKQDSDSSHYERLAQELALKELQKRFGNLWLNVDQVCELFGFENRQTIYNKMRRNAKDPFPVKPKKVCGRWYWSIVKLAEFMAE